MQDVVLLVLYDSVDRLVRHRLPAVHLNIIAQVVRKGLTINYYYYFRLIIKPRPAQHKNGSLKKLLEVNTSPTNHDRTVLFQSDQPSYLAVQPFHTIPSRTPPKQELMKYI